MHTKNKISLICKTLYGIMLLVIFLSALGGGNLPSARAQEVAIVPLAGANVSLSADYASFGTAEDVILHVTITNPNSYSIRVLKWFTPLEGVERPLFTILRDGEPVDYIGILGDRNAPTEHDYITLKAGESLTSDVNLSSYYDLSISGNYEVIYNVFSLELYMEGENGDTRIAGRLNSNALTLWIEGRPNVIESIVPQIVTESTGFSNCNASQQSNLLSARSGASSYAYNSSAFFANDDHGQPYTSWFGFYDITRYTDSAMFFL